jgi:hypothetical protein
MIGAFARAQDSEEEARKREPSLKTREVEASPSPSPKTEKLKSKAIPSPTPKPQAKPKPSKTSEPGASSSPKKSPSPKTKAAQKKESESAESTPKPTSEPSASTKKSPSETAKSKSAKKKSAAKKEPAKKKKGTAKAKKAAEPEKTPTAARPPAPTLSASPIERPTPALPRAAAVPMPVPTIGPIEEEPAQVTIEKSGYEKPRGFFARLFGVGRSSSVGGSYRFLTSSVRAAIDRAPVMQRRWQYIVVHNSGTRQGNAAAFDYYHRHVRRMQNGLAYHFVIGNGTSTGNGQIEVGDRWRRQINGGHVHSDYLNNIALGICLVGDFNRDQPTRAQLECAEELIRYLRQRCGKIGNQYAIVKPHREVNPPRWATDCPGDAFPYSWFRRFRD